MCECTPNECDCPSPLLENQYARKLTPQFRAIIKDLREGGGLTTKEVQNVMWQRHNLRVSRASILTVSKGLPTWHERRRTRGLALLSAGLTVAQVSKHLNTDLSVAKAWRKKLDASKG